MSDIIPEQGHGRAHEEMARSTHAERIEQGLQRQAHAAPRRRFPRGTNWFFRFTRALVGYP